MQIGKLSEPALKRSVLRQLNRGNQAGSLRYGADCAVGAESDGSRTLYATVNAVPGFEGDPGRLVTAAVNNLAAGGAEPKAFLVSAVLPPDYEEERLKADMQRIAQAAETAVSETADVSKQDRESAVLGGHTQISDAVNRPIYTVTGIGYADETSCRVNRVLQPGEDLVVAGFIALGGTAALALTKEEELLGRYPFSLVDAAKSFANQMSVRESARAITHFDAAAVHDLSQGGIFNALWEMADRAGVGLEVDLKKIPVRQETIEICEYFNINPYYLYSAGGLLVGTAHGEALVSYLAARGISAAVIGRVTDGNDRVIRNGEECRYLDRPKQDEWYRWNTACN